ncbi:MAG: hypothetical protein WCE21_02825 [Candidatus Babeliales bacterium]
MIRILIVLITMYHLPNLWAGELKIKSSVANVEEIKKDSLGQRIKQGIRDWWYQGKPLPEGGIALRPGEAVELPTLEEETSTLKSTKKSLTKEELQKELQKRSGFTRESTSTFIQTSQKKQLTPEEELKQEIDTALDTLFEWSEKNTESEASYFGDNFIKPINTELARIETIQNPTEKTAALQQLSEQLEQDNTIWNNSSYSLNSKHLAEQREQNWTGSGKKPSERITSWQQTIAEFQGSVDGELKKALESKYQLAESLQGKNWRHGSRGSDEFSLLAYLDSKNPTEDVNAKQRESIDFYNNPSLNERTSDAWYNLTRDYQKLIQEQTDLIKKYEDILKKIPDTAEAKKALIAKVEALKKHITMLQHTVNLREIDFYRYHMNILDRAEMLSANKLSPYKNYKRELEQVITKSPYQTDQEFNDSTAKQHAKELIEELNTHIETIEKKGSK